jgi:hypothetical protein
MASARLYNVHEAVRDQKQFRKVPEVARDLGMIRSVARLIDGQRTPVQRLGFPPTFPFEEKSSKVEEAGRQIGVIRP